MKYVLIFALATMYAAAQQPPLKVVQTFQPGFIDGITINVSDSIATAPKTAHDYAVSRIAAYKDYEKGKAVGMGLTAFSYSYNGSVQSFSVDKDGKIDLYKMSLEDAVLLVYSMQTDKLLGDEQEWDRREKEREDAKKSVPPSHFRVGNERWILYNGPYWSNLVVGDTTCPLQRVRILETDREKQSTVMHELMHVASGCRDTPRLHEVISNLSTPLLLLLQENPDLVKYLTEKKGAK